MKIKAFRAIGLMSGTSLDGVDLVYVKFNKDNGYSFEILETGSYDYPIEWKKKLTEGFNCSGEELMKLNVEYGKYLSELILNFIKDKGIEEIDFIASHGHTIFHQPHLGYTVQIGCGATIAAHTNLKVICDFRVQDVAMGGQGAPLVPIGDKFLFNEYDFCLNLGGFSNISFEMDNSRLAFDICPVNIVLNHYTRQINLEYDDGGRLASQGKINHDLLNELNAISFYQEEQPKSLGFEFVVETILPMIDKYSLSIKDILCTFIEHASIQIANILEMHKVTGTENLLVTGGGAFNTYLISRMRHYSELELIIPSAQIINFKEALIFAFLGVLKDENEVNCLKSVTGASQDHCGGVVFN